MSKQNMKYKVQVNFYHESFPLPGVLSVPGVPELVVLLLHWGGAGAWGGVGGGGHHVLPLKLIALKKSTEVTYCILESTYMQTLQTYMQDRHGHLTFAKNKHTDTRHTTALLGTIIKIKT